MKTIEENCNQLIDKIEEVADLLLTTSLEHSQYKLTFLLRDWMALFPEMVTVYQSPEFINVANDYIYWPEQFKRIMEANDAGDTFLLVDALYYEARENLIIFRDMVVAQELEGDTI